MPKPMRAVLLLLAALTACEKPPPAPTAAEPAGTPAGASYSYAFVEHKWAKGATEPPIKLMSKEDGYCCLVGIAGGFAGGGESVQVELNDTDGYWYLVGKTQQNDTWARIMEVRIKPMASSNSTPIAPDIVVPVN